jgi:hypothetical protein
MLKTGYCLFSSRSIRKAVLTFVQAVHVSLSTESQISPSDFKNNGLSDGKFSTAATLDHHRKTPWYMNGWVSIAEGRLDPIVGNNHGIGQYSKRNEIDLSILNSYSSSTVLGQVPLLVLVWSRSKIPSQNEDEILQY